MAFNNAIRRAASSILPLARRASVAGNQRYIHHSSSALFTAVKNGAELSPKEIFSRSFTSLVNQRPTKRNPDESLIRVIDAEIQCAQESQEEDQVDEVPQGFPFEIEDKPGNQTITLTREYQGETITVEVHMPDIITGEEDDNNDDDGEERANQSNLPLLVKVSKGYGPYLEFSVSAYPDEISIDSLSVKEENSEDEIAYEGPDFSDLDENLQKAFHKYLEIRGIKPSTTNFLHGYMVDKDSREYVTWLKNLQKFVQE